MNKAQKLLRELLDRQSTQRQKMAELAGAEALTPETRAELDGIETGVPDLERQIRAARSAVAEADEKSIAPGPAPVDAEGREMRALRGKVLFSNYVQAAMETRAVEGAEKELNQHMGLSLNRFPLDILAPEREVRATTDIDSNVNQQTWIDRLFSDSAAARIGITMKSVGPGVTSVPVTTAGSAAAQRGRGEAAADAAWTVGVTEIKPTRNAVRAIFTEEDAARLPGLEDALRRDLGAALAEGVDRVIFLGDDGANENRADIAGLTTATGVTEFSISQTDKIKGPETLAKFLALVDGKHAGSLGDLGIVVSVGANTLWGSTVFNSAAENQTIAKFLMDAGLSWMARGDIDTATTNGKFGAFVGAKRHIEGAGCAAVWNSGMLIRDIYSGAAKGEIAITLSYLWGLAFPRVSHFHRLKFVT